MLSMFSRTLIILLQVGKVSKKKRKKERKKERKEKLQKLIHSGVSVK